MVTTKATVRRIPQVIPLGRVGGKNILSQRPGNTPFKIKKFLPQSKFGEVKKNGRVLKRMNVRRKSYYFSGKRRLQF